MKARHLLSLPLVAIVAVTATQVGAGRQSKPAAAVPDITGSWERHGAGPGARGGGPRDGTIPPRRRSRSSSHHARKSGRTASRRGGPPTPKASRWRRTTPIACPTGCRR